MDSLSSVNAYFLLLKLRYFPTDVPFVLQPFNFFLSFSLPLDTSSPLFICQQECNVCFFSSRKHVSIYTRVFDLNADKLKI